MLRQKTARFMESGPNEWDKTPELWNVESSLQTCSKAPKFNALNLALNTQPSTLNPFTIPATPSKSSHAS
jgi:hypothetical protein